VPEPCKGGHVMFNLLVGAFDVRDANPFPVRARSDSRVCDESPLSPNGSRLVPFRKSCEQSSR
jgi:hypothetical protein